MIITAWCNRFVETDCVFRREPGEVRLYVADEKKENVGQTFLSPRKSTKRASFELNFPKTTVWKQRLHCKPYRLQLVPVLSGSDKEKRHEFCVEMFDKMEEEDDYVNKIVFSDETTFHLSGKINLHNVRMWGTEDPRETVQHLTDLPKPKFSCATSSIKVFDPFLLAEPTVTGISYLDMLEA